jgi:hypothetical protein
MSKAKATVAEKEMTVEERLRNLFALQQIDSTIDKIRNVRGELPLEVNDLEDEVAGLHTRINNLKEEVKQYDDMMSQKKIAIKDAQEAIKRYTAQQDKVRNNREFDSLSKEIEFQNLDIQLSEKRIKEYKALHTTKAESLAEAEKVYTERLLDLEQKKAELNDIIGETQKDEEQLMKKVSAAEKNIDERLLNAYRRIRGNTRNGLGVVSIERDSCGGCFNKIPPQTQIDIRAHKKIIVCEHCGRILIDSEILIPTKK